MSVLLRYGALLTSDGAATDLVVSEAYCETVADAIAATQDHDLSVAEAHCVLDAENSNVTSGFTLAVSEAYSDTVTDTLAITQDHSLSVADAACLLEAENLSLTGKQSLVVAEAACLLAADSPNVSTPTAYSKVRLNITANNGDADQVGINELKVLSVADVGADQCTGGTPSASSYQDEYTVSANAFDDATNTGWETSDGNTTGWIQYDFASPITIAQYQIAPSYYTKKRATAWTFEGWDGSQWVVLDSRSGETTWSSGVYRSYEPRTMAAASAADCEVVSDNIALEQEHSLTVAESYFEAIVTGDLLLNGIDVQGADCEVEADALALSQEHDLAVSEANCAVVPDAISLTQEHSLAVEEAACVMVAEAPVLVQVYDLNADEAHSDIVSDTVSLEQLHDLSVAESYSDIVVDNLGLSQVHNLTVNESASETIVGNLTLTQLHILTVTGGSADLVSDNLTLSQLHNLAVSGGYCLFPADQANITGDQFLDISFCDLETVADALWIGVTPGVADAAILSEADSIAPIVPLVVADCDLSHVAETLSISQDHSLRFKANQGDADILLFSDNIVWPYLSSDLGITRLVSATTERLFRDLTEKRAINQLTTERQLG